MKERRRHPRFKIPPKFKVKARVKLLGDNSTHYLSVDNLSMGGMHASSQVGILLNVKDGDKLEVMLYHKDISLKCVTKVIHTKLSDANAPDTQPLCVNLSLEMLGIDEKSRAVLHQFLEKVEADQLRESRIKKRKTKTA